MRRMLLSSDQRTQSTNRPETPSTLDPDISSYFLVRRATNDSPAASPGPRRRPISSKSPTAVSQKTPKSGDSNRSKRSRERGNSVGSALSVSSKYRHIAEWNEKSSSGISPGALTPVSFEAQRHPADPPRPPRAGLEWVWFPEGYWAEREVRDISMSRIRPRQSSLPRQKWWNRSPEKSKRVSNTTQSDEPTFPQANVPKIKIGSLTSGRARSASEDGKSSQSRHSSKVETLLGVKLSGFHLSKTETDSSNGDRPNEQLGLYCRTKKEIKKRLLTPQTPKPSRAESGLGSTSGMIGWGSRTTTVLEGAAHYLDKAQRDRAQMCASTPALHSSALHSPTTPGARSRRVFGLAPWHRKNSHESFLSVSSSVHELLMGRTPVQTPNPERRYVGHEGVTYPKVEISSPNPQEPTFLPSEAKRINTPPMSPGAPSLNARGFFFDLNGAKDDLDSRSGSPATSAGSGSATGKGKTPREWWEGDAKHTAVGNKSSHQNEKRPVMNAIAEQLIPTTFELTLPPEHLPSSPLCPKNPKHRSGGNGICPFHGRKKEAGLKVVRRVNTGTTSMSNTTNGTEAN